MGTLVQLEGMARPPRRGHSVVVVYTHIKYIILYSGSTCFINAIDVILLIHRIRLVRVDNDVTARYDLIN